MTTDLGVTAFIFGALYFLWRTTRRFTWPDLAGTALFAALALVSKYSALVLVPLAALLLGARVAIPGWAGNVFGDDTRGRLARAGTVLLGLFLVTHLATWAVFGFRYSLTPSPDGRRLTTSAAAYVQEQSPGLAAAVEWIDEQRLLPNASSQGFLFGQARARQRTAYLGGSVKEGGWWFYFPAAFLMKTPLVLLVVGAAGLVLLARRFRERWLTLAFVLLPPAVFFTVAMTGTINIGLRHILPVYPFLLLAAGAAFEWLAGHGRAWVVVVLTIAAAGETLPVHPDYLTFFNRVAGGPARGHTRLLDSNLDWGQDLEGLARWMERENVGHVNLSYFGTADPAYYGIACTHLYGAPFYAVDRVADPRLPGHVAVSATNLHGVYLDPARRDFYAPLLEREPLAVIGGTIHVYHVEKPWW